MPVIVSAIAAVLVAALLCVVPGILPVSISLPEGNRLVIWLHPFVTTLFAAVAAIPALVALIAVRRIRLRGARQGPSVAVALPLAFLPCCFLGHLLQPLASQLLAANLLFYGSAALLSAAIVRATEALDELGDFQTITRKQILFSGIAFSLLFAATGLYFTRSIGEHSGDEKHYIAQAESLWFDGDVDLRNNVPKFSSHKPWEMHVSSYSRNGHAYSWHSVGLPALLAPLVPLGVVARHLVLGVLSGMGCAGILMLCRCFRARAAWSWLVLLLFATGDFWATYSSRCLPEVAGASFAVWSFVALLVQRERPWVSMAICIACCSALPWLHTRFIPVAGVLAGLYVLAAFFFSESWRRRILRLVVFALLFLTAMAAFVAVQFRMFQGGLPLPAGLVLSYPPGMWLVILSERGLLASLPMFAALLAAALWVLASDPGNRARAVVPLLVLVVVLVLGCSTQFWDGGLTVPGRYLLIAVPLFLPCAARALGHADGAFRLWSAFLGIIACLTFAVMSAELPLYRKTFNFAHRAVSETNPWLHGLIDPTAQACPGGLVHGAMLLLAATCTMLLLPVRHRVIRGAMPFVAAAGVFFSSNGFTPPQLKPHTPSAVATHLESAGRSLAAARIHADTPCDSRGLFALSDRFEKTQFRDVVSHASAAESPNGPIVMGQIETNDWAGRGFQWATVVKPFQTSAGPRACRISGRIDGGAKACWAIRHGAQTLVEEPLRIKADGTFENVVRLDITVPGIVYILVRLEGTDSAIAGLRIAWSPYSEVFLRTARCKLE